MMDEVHAQNPWLPLALIVTLAMLVAVAAYILWKFRERGTGRSGTGVCAFAIIPVIALTSCLASPPAGARSSRPSLASSMATLPNAKDQATGVSCVPDGFCFAVDYSGQVYALSGAHATLAGDLGIPTFALSCPAPRFCAVVSEDAVVILGATASDTKEYPLAYGRGSETHWASISCSSPRFCMAGGGLIGGAEDGAGVVSSWNGAVWSPVRVVLPDIPWQFKTQVTSMSCTDPTFCVAADQDERVTQWNGKRWSASVALSGGVESVTPSCLSRRFCLALASRSGYTWTWNGRSWRSTDISELSSLYGSPFLDCLSSSDCVAAMNNGTAQRWTENGWTPVHRVYSDNMDAIQGMGCSSRGFCEAVTSGDHFVYLYDPEKPPTLPVLCSLGCSGTAI
jgi:hypothetical protein